MPKLTRLEYLTPSGWVVGHEGVSLLDPEAYVTRLGKRGKFGRATVLGDRLQPTGEVYETPGVPEDPGVLVPSGTHIPQLPACPICDESHAGPFTGECLL